MTTAVATPNAKLTEAANRRIEARFAANDAAGVESIYLAAMQAAESAAAAYRLLTGESLGSPQGPADDAEAEEEQRFHERARREFEAAETSALYSEVMALGGIRPSSANLAEEYRNVPPCYRRPDGMPGDEMAEHLATNRPEFGIGSESELLEFFAARRFKRAEVRRMATA